MSDVVSSSDMLPLNSGIRGLVWVRKSSGAGKSLSDNVIFLVFVKKLKWDGLMEVLGAYLTAVQVKMPSPHATEHGISVRTRPPEPNERWR